MDVIAGIVGANGMALMMLLPSHYHLLESRVLDFCLTATINLTMTFLLIALATYLFFPLKKKSSQ